MKQFEFRLQKVMETTRTREGVKKRELAQALSVLDENESLLDGMIARLNEQLDRYHARKVKPCVKVSEMMNFSHYNEYLALEILEQKHRIEQLAEQVEMHRERLIEISKDKKILEKLKEKKYDEFRKKMRGVEQKLNDEICLQSYQSGR